MYWTHKCGAIDVLYCVCSCVVDASLTILTLPPFTTQSLPPYAASKPFLEVARELCLEAMMLGSADNVTAQVVDISKGYYKGKEAEEIKE